jgi:hypothetical protein
MARLLNVVITFILIYTPHTVPEPNYVPSELGIVEAEDENLWEEREYPQLVHVARLAPGYRLHHLEHCKNNYNYENT